MIDSYWDLYVAYVDKCVHDNRVNDIDPHHYEMEWNHFFPKCVFGERPLGHWLTKKQHAIVSALQTLSLERNCMCRWHKKHLPKFLVDLAWPYYKRMCSENGKANIAKMPKETLSDNGKTTGLDNLDKISRETLVGNGKATGPANGKASMSRMPKETLSANGKTNVAVMNGHINTLENRRKQGQATGASNIAKMPKETLSDNGKANGKANASQRWQCLLTGHISNPGGLTSYQKARGIDTSLRKKVRFPPPEGDCGLGPQVL
jgi:hypothetical protein